MRKKLSPTWKRRKSRNLAEFFDVYEKDHREIVALFGKNNEDHRKNNEDHRRNDEDHQRNDEYHRKNDEYHQRNDEYHRKNDEYHRKNDQDHALMMELFRENREDHQAIRNELNDFKNQMFVYLDKIMGFITKMEQEFVFTKHDLEKCGGKIENHEKRISRIECKMEPS